MSEPLVVCVMLTKDRPDMAARAVRSFHSQTYGNKRLFVLDTGAVEAPIKNEHRVYSEHYPGVVKTIGALRNWANEYASDQCLGGDIIAHLDDDDWSHPRRLEEQVKLLQESGADCVGYRDMLFWRTHVWKGIERTPESVAILDGEAWLYTNADPSYALGTSLCYWRKTWEAKPFKNIQRGEDREFIRGLNLMSMTCLHGPIAFEKNREPWSGPPALEPRMIASIHAGNGVWVDESAKNHWWRVPEWDGYCRERMTL